MTWTPKRLGWSEDRARLLDAADQAGDRGAVHELAILRLQVLAEQDCRELNATERAEIARLTSLASRARAGGSGQLPTDRQKTNAECRAEIREAERAFAQHGPGRAAERRPIPCSTAYHEAGHAIAYLVRGARLVEVVATPDGGHCLAKPVGDPVAILAGAIACQIVGLNDGGMSVDDKQLLNTALETSHRGAWLPALQQQAFDLLRGHAAGVDAVAQALLRVGRLNGQQVHSIMSEAMRREWVRKTGHYPRERLMIGFHPSVYACA